MGWSESRCVNPVWKLARRHDLEGAYRRTRLTGVVRRLGFPPDCQRHCRPAKQRAIAPRVQWPKHALAADDNAHSIESQRTRHGPRAIRRTLLHSHRSVGGVLSSARDLSSTHQEGQSSSYIPAAYMPQCSRGHVAGPCPARTTDRAESLLPLSRPRRQRTASHRQT